MEKYILNFKRDNIIPILKNKPCSKYELAKIIGISDSTVKGYISRINQSSVYQIQLNNSNEYEIIRGVIL
jgi:predicted transcriptional regulator